MLFNTQAPQGAHGCGVSFCMPHMVVHGGGSCCSDQLENGSRTCCCKQLLNVYGMSEPHEAGYSDMYFLPHGERGPIEARSCFTALSPHRNHRKQGNSLMGSAWWVNRN